MTSKNSKSRRRDKAAGARDCNDDGGDDDGTELSEAELQRFVSDAVLYVVSSAGRRSAMSSSSSSRAPIIRKGEVLKAVGLSGKKRDVQDSVMALAARNLVDVFGLKLMDLGDADSSVPRNTYVLVNCMPTSHPGGSSGVSGAADDDDEKCQSETGLLFVVLAAIFMNGGSLTDDVLDPFLVKLGLLPSDSNAGKGNPSGGDRRADCNHPVLGDVKALIRNIFCTRQQYIEMAKIETEDPEVTKFEYAWGPRAELEVDKSALLKLVADIYKCEPADFRQQYDKIIAETREAEEDSEGDAAP